MTAAPPLSGDFDLAEKLRLLQKDKKRAQIAIEIWKLKEKRTRGYASDEDSADRSRESQDQVTVEKACCAPNPTKYLGTLQQTFNTYVKEVGHTFVM